MTGHRNLGRYSAALMSLRNFAIGTQLIFVLVAGLAVTPNIASAQEFCSEPLQPQCTTMGDTMNDLARITRCEADVDKYAEEVAEYTKCIQESVRNLENSLEKMRESLKKAKEEAEGEMENTP